jgi:hypothetical protein
MKLTTEQVVVHASVSRASVVLFSRPQLIGQAVGRTS